MKFIVSPYHATLRTARKLILRWLAYSSTYANTTQYKTLQKEQSILEFLMGAALLCDKSDKLAALVQRQAESWQLFTSMARPPSTSTTSFRAHLKQVELSYESCAIIKATMGGMVQGIDETLLRKIALSDHPEQYCFDQCLSQPPAKEPKEARQIELVVSVQLFPQNNRVQVLSLSAPAEFSFLKATAPVQAALSAELSEQLAKNEEKKVKTQLQEELVLAQRAANERGNKALAEAYEALLAKM